MANSHEIELERRRENYHISGNSRSKCSLAALMDKQMYNTLQGVQSVTGIQQVQHCWVSMFPFH